MEVTVERLKAARKVLVRIAQAREDGAQFVRMILELERRIAAEAGLSDDIDRIMNESA